MALEDRGAQQDKIPVDKYHDPNADYEMTTRDYVLRPSADGDSGPIVITLPPVAEAKGRWYSIIVRDADAVNTVTITDNPGAGGGKFRVTQRVKYFLLSTIVNNAIFC